MGSCAISLFYAPAMPARTDFSHGILTDVVQPTDVIAPRTDIASSDAACLAGTLIADGLLR